MRRAMVVIFAFFPVLVLYSPSYAVKTSSADVWTGQELRLRADHDLEAYGGHWWGSVRTDPPDLPVANVRVPGEPLPDGGKPISNKMRDFLPQVWATVSSPIERRPEGQPITGVFHLDLRYMGEKDLGRAVSVDMTLDIPVEITPQRPLLLPLHKGLLRLGAHWLWALGAGWLLLMLYTWLTTGFLGHVVQAFLVSFRDHLRIHDGLMKVVLVAGILLQVAGAAAFGEVYRGSTKAVIFYGLLGLVHAIYWTKLILPPDFGRQDDEEALPATQELQTTDAGQLQLPE